jgi:hypothetical protein
MILFQSCAHMEHQHPVFDNMYVLPGEIYDNKFITFSFFSRCFLGRWDILGSKILVYLKVSPTPEDGSLKIKHAYRLANASLRPPRGDLGLGFQGVWASPVRHRTQYSVTFTADIRQRACGLETSSFFASAMHFFTSVLMFILLRSSRRCSHIFSSSWSVASV